MPGTGSVGRVGSSTRYYEASTALILLYRALQSHLQPKSAEEYQPLQMSQAKNMILNLLDDPDNFQNHATT
jgi:hypothetical protein